MAQTSILLSGFLVGNPQKLATAFLCPVCAQREYADDQAALAKNACWEMG